MYGSFSLPTIPRFLCLTIFLLFLALCIPLSLFSYLSTTSPVSSPCFPYQEHCRQSAVTECTPSPLSVGESRKKEELRAILRSSFQIGENEQSLGHFSDRFSVFGDSRSDLTRLPGSANEGASLAQKLCRLPAEILCVSVGAIDDFAFEWSKVLLRETDVQSRMESSTGVGNRLQFDRAFFSSSTEF